MAEFIGKKLLILAGQDVHCKVVEAAKEMGVHTIVADYLDVKDSPAKQIADEHVNLSILDVDAIVDYCKKNHVDGVLNFSNELAARVLPLVCEKLNLPCSASSKQIKILSDKTLFKEYCRKNNVDTPCSYIAGQSNIDFPVLCKPIDSRGSRGVFVCHSAKELEDAVAKAKEASLSGGIVIEKYLDGYQDLNITYLFKNGEAYLTSMADRYPGQKEYGLDRQINMIIAPSRYTKLYMENVNDRVVKMLKNLGIQDGAVFMQGFVVNDTVVFYDPANRFPGNEYERILEKTTGISTPKRMVAHAIGCDALFNEVDEEKLKEAYQLGGKCGIQLMVNLKPGKITKITGLEEVAQNPAVIRVQHKRYAGETIEQTSDIKHRVCEIVAVVDRNADSVKNIIDWIYSKIQYIDEQGNNMVLPFDTEIVSQNYSKIGGAK